MKKTETIEVTRVYCDVCGELCEGGHMTLTRDGEERHACNAVDAKRGLAHWQILRDRIGWSGPAATSEEAAGGGAIAEALPNGRERNAELSGAAAEYGKND